MVHAFVFAKMVTIAFYQLYNFMVYCIVCCQLQCDLVKLARITKLRLVQNCVLRYNYNFLILKIKINKTVLPFNCLHIYMQCLLALKLYLCTFLDFDSHNSCVFTNRNNHC